MPPASKIKVAMRNPINAGNTKTNRARITKEPPKNEDPALQRFVAFPKKVFRLIELAEHDALLPAKRRS